MRFLLNRRSARTGPAGLAARASRLALGQLGVLAILSAFAPVAAAKVHCSRIAAPYGSDRHGNGSHRRPYRTLNRLDAALRPGQTGCLRGGVYGALGTRHWIFRDGTWRHPITMRAYPGERVTLRGWIQITASHTKLSYFHIDGANDQFPGPTSGDCPRRGTSAGLSIEGVGVVFEHNDYYESVASLRGTGIGIGWSGSGNDTIIRYNRIHDVGQCKAFDQLIYLAHGRNVHIHDNWLWNDRHGWGVQVYPGPSGALIYNNVIYEAGSGFTVGGDASTRDNRIYHNVVLDSTGLANAGTRGLAISDYWAGSSGAGNMFAENDSFRNADGLARVSAVHLWRNLMVNPNLVDPATHDFRALPTSRLHGWGLWDGGLGSTKGLRRRH